MSNFKDDLREVLDKQLRKGIVGCNPACHASFNVKPTKEGCDERRIYE